MARHNDMFRSECDWERQFRKRKCRLISCTENVFEQVQQASADRLEGIQKVVKNKKKKKQKDREFRDLERENK